MTTTPQWNCDGVVNFCKLLWLWNWNHQVIARLYLRDREPFGFVGLIAILRLLTPRYQERMLFGNMQFTPAIAVEAHIIDVPLIWSLHRVIDFAIPTLVGQNLVAFLDLFNGFLALA